MRQRPDTRHQAPVTRRREDSPNTQYHRSDVYAQDEHPCRGIEGETLIEQLSEGGVNRRIALFR